MRLVTKGVGPEAVGSGRRLLLGMVAVTITHPARAASPLTPDLPVPALAEEAELAGRIARYRSDRDGARADLDRARAAAAAELAAVMPTPDSLASGGVGRVGRQVASLARRLAQIELWQAVVAAGEAASGLRPAGSEAFSERDNLAWYAALLAATGDNEVVDPIVRYARIPPEVPRLVAEVVVAESTAREAALDALASRLREAPKDVGVAFAVDVLLRRGVGRGDAFERLELTARELADQSVNPLRASMTLRIKADRSAAIASLVGQSGFAIVGTLADGADFDPASLVGKVVAVVFWSPRSAACLAELPRLVALQNRHRDEGLTIVMVHSERGGRHVTEFLERHPEASWPNLVDREATEKGMPHPLAVAAGISKYPTMLLLDRRGILRSQDAFDGLEPTVAALLAERSVVPPPPSTPRSP